ncbi:MAG: ABC-F family ATP-binding cassette domain-containing protein [Ruminococcaceae bacterium]|nr:ABC-F family ATP-binding cassette domain-containing protein [Oscillospiraceae bacterium]
MILSVNNLGMAFGTDVILDSVSFSLNEGERLAVVGINGAGKSTLLRILCGELEDYSGSFSIQGGKTLGFLKQNFALESDNTVIEEMMTVFGDFARMETELSLLEERMEKGDLGAVSEYERQRRRYEDKGGLEYKSRMMSALAKMGFGSAYHNVKINTLSGGQKTVLSLVKLLLTEPDVLILDEPTNHLDMNALSWLEDYIKKLRSTVIIVSHDRYFLDKTTNKTLEIENTHSTLYNCSYTAYRDEKKKRFDEALKHYKEQQKEIKRMEEFIKLQHKWNREKNIKAADSRQKALDRMVKLERPDNEPAGYRFSFENSLSSGNNVLSVNSLKKAYGDRVLFSQLSFEVKRYDRLFIIGANGCGKSTLLKILNSKCEATDGAFEYGYNVKVGYYDQENQQLSPELTVFDELWQYGDSMQRTRDLLALFGFKGDDVFKRVNELSGGEKARLTLAKLMLQKVNLLILDEPTNHLDIISREALENAVKQFDGTVIAVSHDRYFINSLATDIVDIGGDPRTGESVVFKGNYESYLEYRNKFFSEYTEETNKQKVPGANKEAYLLNKKLKSLERSRENNLKRTEARINEVEEEIKSIDEKMNTDAQSDYKLLEELFEKKQALEGELEELYEKWETLQ